MTNEELLELKRLLIKLQETKPNLLVLIEEITIEEHIDQVDRNDYYLINQIEIAIEEPLNDYLR